MYTTEAFGLYLSRLSDSGILAGSRWLKLPPRDSLRVFATSLAALREMGVTARPEQHLLFITSWKTSTILVSKTPFTSEELDRAIEFCKRRSFDLAYYAGMKGDMANRFDILDQPHYYNGAKALSSAESDSFLRRYLFDVSPTTDDRPYFSHFFRWDKAVALFQMLRREGLPLIDMGYIFVIATLLQALVASGDPDRFADVVLTRLPKNPAVIVVPDWWKIVWWLNRLSPSLGDALTSRTYRRIREKWAVAEVAPNQH